MKSSDFTYELPAELIAKYPPEKRGDSRLLIVDRVSGEMKIGKYGDFVNYLGKDDGVVLNSSRVINARFKLKTQRNDKEVELLLIKQVGQNWEAIVGNSRNVQLGDRLLLSEVESGIQIVEQLQGGLYLVKFEADDQFQFISQYGEIPIPPYLKREPEEEDYQRYNTTFAKKHGSVAAPTASLNITDELLRLVRNRSTLVEVDLQVGWGTFAPVRTEVVEQFKIHSERFTISEDSAEKLNRISQAGGKVMAFGTTSSRVLETVCKLDDQGRRSYQAMEGETDIYIYPGYNWKSVDMLLTNFHAPSTSLLFLVASFMGRDLMKEAYSFAIDKKMRFLSYGDSMLIL